MPFINAPGGCRTGRTSLTDQTLSLWRKEWMEQHEPSPTGTSLPSDAKHLNPVQREQGLEQHTLMSTGCKAQPETWQKCLDGRFRNISVFPHYGCGIRLCTSWKGNSSMSWGSLPIPTFTGFEGNGLKTSQCGYLGQLKERTSTLLLDGQEISWDMLRCPRTGAQVTSAYLCGSSGTDIVKAWSAICFSWGAKRHWKHGLYPQIGVGFFAFEVAKCKELELHSMPTATTICTMWMAALRDEARLISSHQTSTKWNCSHLTFTRYQRHQNWWLDPKYCWNQEKGISEKYQTLSWQTQ